MTRRKYRKQIEEIIAIHQRVQMVNSPSSARWMNASLEINRLAKLLSRDAEEVNEGLKDLRTARPFVAK